MSPSVSRLRGERETIGQRRGFPEDGMSQRHERGDEQDSLHLDEEEEKRTSETRQHERVRPRHVLPRREIV